MKNVLHSLAIFMLTGGLLAQDANDGLIGGSQIVADVLEAYAGEIEVDIPFSTSGTTHGLALFCQGELLATGATRPISVEEEAVCLGNEIPFLEYLVGYDALALIANPDVDFVECLTEDDLNAIFAPSASGIITSWDQTTIVDAPASPLSIFIPQDNTATSFLFDEIVSGLGLRQDVTTQSDSETLIQSVADTPGAIGVVSASAVTDDRGVTVLQIENTELGECYVPSVDTIESRQYALLQRLLLYVNAEHASEIESLMSALTDEEYSQIVAEQGFLAPSATSYELNQAILNGEAETGRQFSREVTAFRIPDTLFGAVGVGGSSNLVDFMLSATESFSAEYPSVTFEQNIEGESSGRRQLCNGEIDFLAATEDLPPEEVENCTANNINLNTYHVGSFAAVLVANESDEFLECLTTEQVITIWGSGSTGTVIAWNGVDETFPDTDILLVSPSIGSSFAIDLMLTPPNGVTTPQRDDVAEENADGQYRAIAVSNAEGAITYMTWVDYVETDREGIQLVAIDGGEGCVVPSETTIEDGSYPFTWENDLIVNRRSLAQEEVQSFLWYLFSDVAYQLFEDAGLVGIAFEDLPGLREQLQDDFATAIAETAELLSVPEVEATAEVTTEPSGE